MIPHVTKETRSHQSNALEAQNHAGEHTFMPTSAISVCRDKAPVLAWSRDTPTVNDLLGAFRIEKQLAGLGIVEKSISDGYAFNLF